MGLLSVFKFKPKCSKRIRTGKNAEVKCKVITKNGKRGIPPITLFSGNNENNENNENHAINNVLNNELINF
eukprot:Pgem_evm1s5406